MNEVVIPLVLTFLAGLSTTIGALIYLFIKKVHTLRIGFLLGLSAGVMIYLSFVDLLPSAIEQLGLGNATLLFFLGIVFMMILDFVIPHQYLREKTCYRNGVDVRLFSTGLMVAVGIAIHNFPEGVAVFISTFTNTQRGIMLGLAIAIHNIPEGLAIAVPIYHATKNRWKALGFAFFAGIVEPIGGILAYLVFRNNMSPNLLSSILAFVGGIMVFISFDELLPSCFQNREDHSSIFGIVAGMGIMAISMCLFNV